MHKSEKNGVKAGYHVAIAMSVEVLEEKVAQHIAAGWTPLGGMTIGPLFGSDTSPTFFQALWYRNGAA